MKLKFFIFSFFLASSSSGLAWAQETIIEALETPLMNEGVIKIKSDPSITALLGRPGFKVKPDSDNYDTIKMNGFRILVFMGNDPKKSRMEAFDRQELISSAFPDAGTYVDYDAPNWKTLVGDFMTREEASLFNGILQKEFPQFGREVYVVASKINIPVEKK